VDSPNNAAWKYGSLVSKDMVTQVDATCASQRDRLHRGLCGVSMGGFGALHHIRASADTFSVAFAVVPLCDLRNWDYPNCSFNLCAVFGNTNATWDPYNPALNVNGYSGKNITFALQTGDCSAGCSGSTVGDFWRNESIAFHDSLTAAGVTHTFNDLPNTGHDYPTPQRMVEILRYFETYFNSH
jgi:S-formylglutathione hydrolase FrmB